MKPIDCWFEFGSNYSYPAVMRLPGLAEKAGVRIHWKPFLLGPIFQSFGWTTSPFVTQKEKGTYVWRDMERVCDKHGIPWRKPTTFPRRAVLPMRVALMGADEPWMVDYCREMMLRNFACDSEIDNPQAVGAVLTALGLDAGTMLARAQSDANKAALRAQTDEARCLGIFGAPTFVVGGEMFWGNDRLEDALAWAAQSA